MVERSATPMMAPNGSAGRVLSDTLLNPGHAPYLNQSFEQPAWINTGPR